MFLSIIKIRPLPELRCKVLNILDMVTGPIRVEAGCQGCFVSEERGDEGTICYIEQWKSIEDMRRHFQSDSYRRVLAAIELSHDAPEVEIHEITRTLGMEMIIKLVSTGLQEENDI